MALGPNADNELKPRELRQLTKSSIWKETFPLLFEILADDDKSSQWPLDLADWLFGPNFEELDIVVAKHPRTFSSGLFMLVAALAADPYSGLDCRRQEMIRRIWKLIYEIDNQLIISELPRTLFSAPKDIRENAWYILKDVYGDSTEKTLYLSGCDQVDLYRLSGFADVNSLFIVDSNIVDLSNVGKLKFLKHLDVSRNPVLDISPTKNLKRLESIVLDDTNVSDVSPLAELVKLSLVSLDNTKISDLTPFSKLKNMEYLWVRGTAVSDIAPLAGLLKLEGLFISDTKVADITPLVKTKNLRLLYIENSMVNDLSPLLGHKKIMRIVYDDKNIVMPKILKQKSLYINKI